MDEAEEIEDFFARHLDDIAEAMKEPDVIHSRHCTRGKRRWIFTWRWPFVITWISNAVCLCEINQMLRGNRLLSQGIEDIVAALEGIDARQQRAIYEVDLDSLSPCAQMAVVRAWKRRLRGE
jgi:hypothetical protein